MVKVKITTVEEPYSGMHVDFVAPCDCTVVEGLVINSNTYTVVDSLGNVMTGSDGAWAEGSIVSVILDCVNKRAYVQNPGRTALPTKWQSNKNLLDNWYFSKPVNQRGETSYNALGYTIDRWYNRNAQLKVEILAEGVKTSKVSATDMGAFNQRLEFPEEFLGKTMTLSFLLKDVTAPSVGTAYIGAYLANSVAACSFEIGASENFTTGVSLVTCTFTMPESLGNYTGFNVTLRTSDDCSNDFKATLIAAKLELGDTQTLAHLENGNWVLNEIPTYAEELAKCQRYFQRLPIRAMVMGNFNGVGYWAMDFPVYMRTQPTYTFTKDNASSESTTIGYNQITNNLITGWVRADDGAIAYWYGRVDLTADL